ncbi:DUF934 domain-containing protein [Nitrosomonadales bacterium]|nr:DUF934 domain-containing protein [Nitrosomonadales bacterium]
MKSQLIKNKNIVNDEWITVELPKIEQKIKMQAGKVVAFKLSGEDYPTDDQVIKTKYPETGKILLPLKVFRYHQEKLNKRFLNKEIGIWFSTHEEIHKFIEVLGDLNNFPLIAIYVEKFSDGRIFSIGNQLRNKYKFRNELRALGDVLKDQIYFLKRSGFTSYLIRKDRDPNDAIKSLDDFTEPYQGAFDILDPVWKRIKR